jgi:outer membrane murein-binding lipoprotein Lpp
VKKILIAGLAALLTLPALAQNVAASPELESAQQQIEALKAQLERLEATVDYLKANAMAARKDAAGEAVDVSNLKTSVGKYTWSGDFRYRHELIDAEENATGRTRDRIRVRFGVLAKVNDRINAKLQFSTTSSGNDNARSTNQTLGTGWDRKPLGIDQAYVDWKANDLFNLTLGKMPIPWTRTASYFWDNDLTPEGAALKFARGPIFAGVYYNWLNERDVGKSSAASTDANMVGAQLGIKQAFGKSTLTAAVAYFDLNGVQDQVTAFAAPDPAALPVAFPGCVIDGAFGSGQGVGNNAFGNTTYSGAAPQVGSSAAAVCTRLQSDFNLIEALVQLDFSAGRYPMSAFVDYMQNNAAKVNSKAGKKLDTALSAGFVFNKASAPRSWEAGFVYQQGKKDAIFGQFHDSDFGGGVTDTDGYALKGAWVPAAGWTFNGTYFINQRFNDVATATGIVATAKKDYDYKRLQLDLNYKF